MRSKYIHITCLAAVASMVTAWQLAAQTRQQPSADDAKMKAANLQESPEGLLVGPHSPGYSPDPLPSNIGYTFDANAGTANTWDALNDPSNEVYTEDPGVTTSFLSLSWEADLAVAGASWCSEARIRIAPEGGQTPFNITMAAGVNAPCAQHFSGCINFAALGGGFPASYTATAGSVWTYQFFESFDDVPDAIDATFTNFSMTWSSKTCFDALPGGSCETAEVINCGDSLMAVDTTGYLSDYNLPSGNACTGFTSSGPDRVFVLNTGDCEMNVSAVMDGQSAGYDGSFYRVTDCANLLADCIGEDCFPPPCPKSLNFVAAANTDYFLIVDGFTGPEFGTSNITVTCTPTSVCGDGVAQCDEECDDGNLDDGDCCSSSCTFEPADSACGDGGESPCDHADTCDGAGNCLTNLEPAGTACGDGPSDCSDQDTCDGAGACLVNDLAAGTACGDGPTACSDQDTCDGAGACLGNDLPAGTNCGAGPTVCSGQDTCNGNGGCLPNHLPASTECRAAADECDVAEACDGAGNCPADVTITQCAGGDGCCPDGCLNDTDSDCPVLEEPVPALSQLGMIGLALLLVLGIAIKFRTRRVTA